MPQTTIQISTQFQGTGTAAAKVALGQVGQEASKAEKQLLAYAQATASAQRQQGDAAGAVRTLTAAIAQVAPATKQAIAAEGQLAAAIQATARQNAAALPRTLEAFGTEAIDQFKSGLLGIVGPAAVAGAAITALGATVQSFKNAFTFKAELDATTRAITTNLEGIRDQGAVFREAQQFADRYRLTQKETTEILANSTDILRSSSASVSDLESSLLRLQSRDPSKPISEAARALRELNSGDTTTIKELFNISANDANRMKNEIAAGGDAVAVLNGYLDRAGVGMAVLENRSKGAAGAMNEQKIAQEQLALAQANFAAGPGLALLQTQTELTRNATTLLTGDIRGLTDAMQTLNVGGINPVLQPLLDYNAYVLDAGQKALVWAGIIKEANPGLVNQAGASDAAAQAALFYANHARNAGNAAALAAGQVDLLTAAQRRQAAAQGLADQRAGERSPGTSGQAEVAAEDDRRAQNVFRRLAQPAKDAAAAEAKKNADAAAAQAKRLKDAQDALNLSRATTKEAKIRELQRQQAASSDPVEKLQLQAQIEAERRSGAGRVGAAQTTALQLNDIARTSGDDRLRIERENLERLRDQQEDFDVSRSRKQEDFERERRKLLAEGRRAEAARLTEDFNRNQQRDQEDFDRNKRRTLRNNAESLGDQSTKVENRVDSVNARAAAKGVTPAGDATPLPVGSAATQAADAQQRLIQVMLQATVNMDGKQVGVLTYPTIKQQLDNDLALEFSSTVPPGAGQTSVAGGRP